MSNFPRNKLNRVFSIFILYSFCYNKDWWMIKKYFTRQQNRNSGPNRSQCFYNGRRNKCLLETTAARSSWFDRFWRTPIKMELIKIKYVNRCERRSCGGPSIIGGARNYARVFIQFGSVEVARRLPVVAWGNICHQSIPCLHRCPKLYLNKKKSDNLTEIIILGKLLAL